MPKLRLKWALPLGLVLMLLAGCFSPALTPFLWHLRHGDVIELGGKRITVPKDWYPEDVEYYDVRFSKPPLTVFSGGKRRVFAYLSALPGRTVSTQEANQRFETTWRAVFAAAGDETPSKIAIEEGNGVCMEHSRRQNPDQVVISCSLFSAAWGAGFSGDVREASKFLSIIRGIRSAER